MRKILWLLVTIVAIYSGYWLIGARASERGIAIWLDARGQNGWQAEYSELNTTGYPFAFTSKITDLALADPATGAAYKTPHISIASKSYAPTRFMAHFAPTSTISSPYQNITLQNEDMHAALNIGAGTSLPLLGAAIDIETLSANSTAGWGFTLDHAHISTLRDADDDLIQTLNITATGLAPSADLMSKINSSNLLSDTFDTLTADAVIRFDRPWDIHALEGPRPQPRSIIVENVTAQWGQLDLRLAADMKVDAQGIPTGTIYIQAKNWREMVSLALSAGVVPQNLEALIFRAGELIAGLKGNDHTLDAELTLKDGRINFGFLPLGKAPRFILR